MEVKKEIKTVQQEVTVYVAEDGTEFPTSSMCKAYEVKLYHNKLLEAIKPLEYREDGKRPCDGMDNPEHYFYKWYKVNSQEDVDKLLDVYDTYIKTEQFPEYINIQQSDPDDYSCWSTTLSNCKAYVKEFFADFGIEVEFKEV